MNWSIRAVVLLVLLLGPGLPNRLWAQNLVPNGGFEDGLEGWAGGQVVTDSPHGGEYCLRVIDDDPAGDLAARTLETIPISRDKAYVFEAWVRADAEDRETLVTLNQFDELDEWISGYNLDFVVATGTEWTHFRMVIRAFHPDAAAVGVRLRPVRWTPGGELTGTAWFDDVSLVETALGPPVRGDWLVDEGDVRVWISPVEQKVGRTGVPALSAALAADVQVAAARGEAEPFQLVLLPSAVDSLTEVSVSSLNGPLGAFIDGADVSIREVAYVEVVYPTDHASYVGWRPDPLPRFEPPLALAADEQQPLWFTIRVPPSTTPGEYTGTVRLEFAFAEDIDIPLRLHVWGFELPEARHFRTAYGLSLWLIDRYHHLQGDAEARREVLRLYLRDFAEHRISPYDPFGDDWYVISFPNWNWEGGKVIPDADSVSDTDRLLEVVDDRTDAAVSAGTALAVPIDPGNEYRISWMARTDGSHDYLVALNQYDGDDAWISGWNIDLYQDGDGTWQSVDVVLGPDDFHDDAAGVRVRLYARGWTPSGDKTGRTWFDDVSLTPEPVGENLIVNGDLDLAPEDIEISADFSAFDEAGAWALDGLGFDGIRLRLPGFARGDWQGGHPGSLLCFDWGTPEYETLFGRVLRVITDHLHDQGWLSRAYAYWYDEPTPEDYPMVIQGMSLLGEADPRLARLLTEHAEPELAGLVDIWVPILHEYGREWASECQALGEAVWWYVCTGPRSPYPNNFIDHPGIEHRIRFWMAWQYGVEGSLYWSTSYWTRDEVFPPPDWQDPWIDPMSYNPSGRHWGNGDGRLLYPPRGWADGVTRIEGPTPSIRWELLREGIEDYETFWLLREAADELERRGLRPDLVTRARGLLIVPDTIFTTPTEYTDDPTRLARHRLEVGGTLEEIRAVLETPGPEDDGGLDVGPDAEDMDMGADVPDVVQDAADTAADLGDDVPDVADVTDMPEDPTDAAVEAGDAPVDAEPQPDIGADADAEPDATQPDADGPSDEAADPERPVATDTGACQCHNAEPAQGPAVLFLGLLALVGLARRRSRERHSNRIGNRRVRRSP